MTKLATILALPLLIGSGVSNTACLRQVIVNSAADALSGGGMNGGAFARDDDPELIAEAMPFGLKIMESLLDETPNHRGLLVALAGGFTQYAQGFVLPRSYDADNKQAEHIEDRVVRLHLRAHGYALRALALRDPSFMHTLGKDPKAAAALLRLDDVDAMYWASASLLAAISLSTDNMQIVAKLPRADALAQRAMALDPDWGQGSLHELFISYEGRSASMGGSAQRAKQHFNRAIALSQGHKASPYVALAEAVAVPAQDRAAFDKLLQQALDIDIEAYPDLRLANQIAQDRARWLQKHVEDLIL